jgi:hypothetical protein
MAKGIKTGGRSSGTSNRSTAEVKQKLEVLGCDPIEGMARIAVEDTAIAVHTRVEAKMA